jgi:hypothetical protein
MFILKSETIPVVYPHGHLNNIITVFRRRIVSNFNVRCRLSRSSKLHNIYRAKIITRVRLIMSSHSHSVEFTIFHSRNPI